MRSVETESGLHADIHVDLEGSEDECGQTEDIQSLGREKSIKGGAINYRAGKGKFKKLCTVLKLLRYASRREKLMLLLGVIVAFAHGAIAPLNILTIQGPAMAIFIEEERRFYDNTSLRTANRMEDDRSTLLIYGYLFYIFAFLIMIISFSHVMLSERSSENIIAKIKTDYLRKLLSVNIGWYDKCEDQFVSTVSHDLQKMKSLFDSRMTSTVEIISFYIWGNLVGFSASTKVALVTFVILMISITVIYLLMQVSKVEGRKQREYSDQVTKITSEVLGNARTVAAYRGETNEVERYEESLRGVEKYGFRQAGILTLARGFNYFIFCFCFGAAFYFSAWLYYHGNFSPEYVMVVQIGQTVAIYHLTAMLSTISDMMMAVDSAYKVMSVLETDTNYKTSMESGLKLRHFIGNIKFRKVVFSYPTNPQTKVLKDLNLEIEPGKITAVVGKSGAGKSTIAGLITRLYDTTFGQVLIDGVEVRDLNVSWLRNQIGVVMQEPTLFDASIEENIRFGKPDATREEIEDAARLSYAHDFINELPAGYNSVVGEKGVKLSGGQKQRIAIARALVRRPKLLLLDEATSALDTRSEEIVQEALDNAMIGRTTFIIAHRMSTVRKAHYIYAMKDGIVVEEGSHAKLMEQKGYYFSLVQTQELEEKDNAFRAIRKLSRSMTKALEEETVEEDEDRQPGKDDVKPVQCRLKNWKLMLMWLIAFIFCCFVSAFLPSFYYVFTLLCQTYSHKLEDIEQLAVQNVLLVAYVAIISFFAVIGSGVTATRATQMWLGKVRRKAFMKVVSMDISWYDESGNTPNETLETLINSPTLVESVAGDKIAQVIIFFLSIIFSLVFSLSISTTITLVNLPIIIFFISMNVWRLRNKMSDAKSSKHITKSTKIATEYVQNVKTIQLLNCQDYVIPQYEKILKLAKKEAWKGIVFYALVYGLTKSLIAVAMGSSLVIGSDLICRGEVMGTELLGLVTALSTASLLAGPSLVLMSQYPVARQALSRLYRILQSNNKLDVFSDSGSKPLITGKIVFKDVEFSYPTRQKVQVLNKLNLTIEPGKMIALIGNSGCGKSTIISLLQRFYFPQAGQIIVDGVDIQDINVGHLREAMGLVSQEPVLFDLTVRENIVYGLQKPVSENTVISAARVANIHETILKLPQGYDTMVGEQGSKLSGGQKQRIAIARAVLRDPKILLLDEATSALDTENEKIVQEALEKASVGRTTIIIAHRLSTIRKAEKIVVLERGIVVEEGTHEELLRKQGHYYNLLHQS